MSTPSPTYSHLSPDQQETLSTLVVGFEQRYNYEGAAALSRTFESAAPELRGALLAQLLPPLIDQERKKTGRTPTLHELRLQHPNLAAELGAAYAQLPGKYRLPTELHGYRVLSVIGEGGQSIVLRAQDDVHSAVAIKLSTSAEHNELILRERKLLGECDHPGVIRVIGSGKHADRAYFIMPYLRGTTLVDRFSVRRPTTDDVLTTMKAVCSALDHLHKQGILHRDIKPANIWIDESGEVKLIDLGMAVQRASWSRPLPAIAEFNGTPAFMSPEQAASDGTKDSELSDLFSAGATLYWMLTGSAPFVADNASESMALAATGKFDRDRLLSTRDYPQALKQLCLQAMEANPARRVASAADLSRELQQIQRRLLHTSASKPIVVLALAAVVVLFVTAAAYLLYSGREYLLARLLPDSHQETLPADNRESAPVEPVIPEDDDQHQVALEGKSSPVEPGAAQQKQPVEQRDDSHQQAAGDSEQPASPPGSASSTASGAAVPAPEESEAEYLAKLQTARRVLGQLDKENKLASFRYSSFQLLGLSEIADQLTHLYIVGQFGRTHPFELDRKKLPNARFRKIPEFELPESKNLALYASEISIDLRTISLSQPIQLPPVWEHVFFKFRLRDNSITPLYQTKSHEYLCGCGLIPVATEPPSAPFETFLYIAHNEPLDPELSILPYLNKRAPFSSSVQSECQRTRLLLMSTLPVGVTRVEHFADRDFARPVSTAMPGNLYARYVDARGSMVGYATYRLNEPFIHEMADHALGHFTSPPGTSRTPGPPSPLGPRINDGGP